MPDTGPRSRTGWQWHTSRTGAALARVSTAAHTTRAAETMGRTVSGPGQTTVVIDPADDAGFARGFAAGCRRGARFVVHTSPRQRWAWRMQTEVLTALGKHWDRPAQGGDATVAQLAQAWLRAEQARDLVVLRAHHLAGPALDWLRSLPAQEGLRLWLISPRPLPWTDTANYVTVTRADQVATSPHLGEGHPIVCRCEDLNQHPDLATNNDWWPRLLWPPTETCGHARQPSGSRPSHGRLGRPELWRLSEPTQNSRAVDLRWLGQIGASTRGDRPRPARIPIRGQHSSPAAAAMWSCHAVVYAARSNSPARTPARNAATSASVNSSSMLLCRLTRRKVCVP